MSPERFQSLFQKYKTDLLSQEEWEELRPVLQDGVYDELVREDMLGALRGVPVRRIGMRRVGMRRIAMYAAVAVFLVGVSLLWLLWPASSHREEPVVHTAVPENIAPGSDKAVLTLSNGQQIVLDSTHNGAIARQGGVTIVRTDGRIGYDVTDTGAVFYNTITTPKGGQYAVVLADGSKVWLNSASSLRYPTVFTGNERQVALTGEGYFEISKNSHQPFFVNVGKMRVQVLGTSFNVMAYRDEETINTTLLEGAVMVRDGGQAKQLQPGQQAVLDGDDRMALHSADIVKTMAWKNGFFEFDNMRLEMIMRQVARWYDVEIVFREKPDHLPYGGSISKQLSLADLLGLLEANGSHHFKIEGKKVYITQTK